MAELDNETRMLTPHLPLYARARYFLRILEGVSVQLYHSLYSAIWSKRGTPQAQADWTDPEAWIPERLDGEESKLALRIWRESNGELNPRYLRGSWLYANRHGLLEAGTNGKLTITDRGCAFLDGNPDLIAILDEAEGMLALLRLVVERGPAQRSTLLPGFTTFCHNFTTWRSESPIKLALYSRLMNLMDRGYISRSSNSYEVTDSGATYLDKHIRLIPGREPVENTVQTEIRRLARTTRQTANDQLREYLSNMNPFKFEELVKFLLEAMGYSDVEVTSPTNDKGVDVVADIQLGISSVREVVQVKRHRGNINRRVLDQLRGSLHRFDAVRGTIISTGGFSKGTVEAAFERNAAPITLIDGDQLIKLLFEHDIGVTRQQIEYFEFDRAKLEQFDSTDPDDEVKLSTTENA